MSTGSRGSGAANTEGEGASPVASSSPSSERRPLMAGPRDSRRGTGSNTPDAAVSDPAARRRRAQGRQQRENTAEEDEKARVEELTAGMKNMVKLIMPVVLCMAVVCISILAIEGYKEQSNVYLPYTPFHETGDISGGEKFGQALINVIIILAVVVVLTCLLVILIKYRCYKAVTVWLIGASVLALGWFSFFYLYQVFSGLELPMDYITAVLFGWNFCVTGVVGIHWRGPLRCQQFYLISTCVLIALVFIQYLPDWTAWMLLALIAVYDLVAVLAPCGPLRKLVEIAQERDEPLMPSLVYSTTSTLIWVVGTMADAPGRDRGHVPVTSPSRHISADRVPLTNDTESDPSDLEEETLGESGLQRHQAALQALGSTDSEGDTRERRQRRRDDHEQGRPSGTAVEDNTEEEEDKGVKLGLGDFIFYSILVGRATKDSNGDFNVILACFIAIVIGLCLTILLLGIFRKALPALPISIAFGLVFYFSTAKVITPFTDELIGNQLFV